jgi:hypothetical protein
MSTVWLGKIGVLVCEGLVTSVTTAMMSMDQWVSGWDNGSYSDHAEDLFYMPRVQKDDSFVYG